MPDRLKIISGSGLKLIAVITMLIDHTASFLLAYLPAGGTVIFSSSGFSMTICELMRYIGRLSFPLFAFLAVEGYFHTKSIKSYAVRLLIFALISEIPFDLALSGKMASDIQNVLWTILFGICGIYIVDRYDGGRMRQSAALVALVVLQIFFKADYGLSGFSFIMMLYVLRDYPALRAAVGCGILSSRWIAGLAFIPAAMYNGRRGFIRGRVVKYIFYAVYPVHMLLLYFLRLKFIGNI